jgi:hypothetical protein
MRTSGWIIMLASLISVWTLCIWSYAKLLRAPRDDD